MKTRAALGFLLLWAFAAGTIQAADLRVRLFTAAAPVQLQIVPVDATVRTCAGCKPTRFSDAITLVATANVVTYSATHSAVVFVTGKYRLRANGSMSAELSAPLEIRSIQGFLRIVANMPLEQYVAFAIGGEAGGIKEPEALKAIAVAIRTYAIRFRARHETEGFDLCDSTHCQVLRLADSELWKKAAEETEGEMLWYKGEPAYAYHHASCGGVLEDGRVMLGRSVPYLRQQFDDVCSTGSEWDAQIGRDDLRRAMAASGFHLGDSGGVEIIDRDRSGRARTLRVEGAPVDATAFRMAVGRELGWNKVRSELYDVSEQGDSVIFHGRGRGHGVGLCQTGAQLRAQQGAGYRDILSFYYPGTTVGVTARGLQWMKVAGERIALETTEEKDKALLLTAEKVLHVAEHRTGWRLEGKPALRVYPTVSIFRDATGEPGWVAASTIGSTVRLQPVTVLRAKSVLESTLRHEFLHMLVEQQARATTPLWFREGLVLWLCGERPPTASGLKLAGDLEEQLKHPKSEAELRFAYITAHRRVASLVQKNGETTVLKWLKEGLPKALAN